MENAKIKMNRSVGKKVAGLFKGFFNKASQKVKSSLYRRKKNKNRERIKSLQQPMNFGKITLAEDPEDYVQQDSIYS